MGFWELFHSDFWSILCLSLQVSGIAVLISALIGIPLGAWLGLAPRRTVFLLRVAVHTGMALPPVVVGLVLYLLLSRKGPLALFGWLFTPQAMILAQVILALPFVVGITMSSVEAIPRELLPQLRSLGATERRLVMHNDFVLVGPKSDPAQVKSETSITTALTRIAKRNSPFVSRGDASGTHMKEQGLWKEAEISPQGDWYIKAGSGMAQTLRMASEKGAYTITDRGTWLSQRGKLDLVILCEGDTLLRNQYAVIVVDPKKHPHIKADASQRFADFLLGPEAQRAVGDFGRETFGESLFIPQHVSPESRR